MKLKTDFWREVYRELRFLEKVNYESWNILVRKNQGRFVVFNDGRKRKVKEYKMDPKISLSFFYKTYI